jgi:hypothetical protein
MLGYGPTTSTLNLDRSSRSRDGREARQPDQLRQRPVATLTAAEPQDDARETCLGMDVDRGEINRLHLPTAAAIDVEPAIARRQRSTDRRPRPPSR